MSKPLTRRTGPERSPAPRGIDRRSILLGPFAGLTLTACTGPAGRRAPSSPPMAPRGPSATVIRQVLDDVEAPRGLLLLMGSSPFRTDLWLLGRDGLRPAPLDRRPPLYSEIVSAGDHVVLSAGGVSSNGFGDTLLTLRGSALEPITFPAGQSGQSSPAVNAQGMLAYVAKPVRGGTSSFTVHVMPLGAPERDAVWWSSRSNLGITAWGPRNTCAVISNIGFPPNDSVMLLHGARSARSLGPAGGMTGLVWGGGPYLAVGLPGYRIPTARLSGWGFVTDATAASPQRWPLPQGYGPLVWDGAGTALLAMDREHRLAMLTPQGEVTRTYPGQLPGMVYQAAKAATGCCSRPSPADRS